MAASAAELARYALADGQLGEALDLADEARQAAEHASSHTFHAHALAFQGMAADREGRHAVADRAFGNAYDLLLDRGALAFMQMAYTRQFDSLTAALRAARRRH